ncbi:hypothetical protein [Spirosoma areae]
MKTSYILLAILAVVTLTSMIATDVLLKQQYDKIDWRNPYQHFEKRSLPSAKHVVIEGTPINEIIVLQSADKPQALIEPGDVKFYRSQQQGDTLFVNFTPDYSGYKNSPRDDAGPEHRILIRLVLRLPTLQTLRAANSRLTVSDFTTDKLGIMLMNSRLRTHKLTISDAFSLTISQHSFAVLGTADRYTSVHASVQDSSGIYLNNTSVNTLTTDVSPKAEVQLRGQALKWLR